MAVVLVLLLGIGNFAAQGAVMASNHPMVARSPLGQPAAKWTVRAIEFALLVGALTLARGGWAGAAIAYGLYTGMNLFAAWLMLKRKL